MADLFERFAPGTISIANAATAGTGTGTELTVYEKGDLLIVPGRGVVQLSAKPTSDTAFAFEAPYLGTAIVDADYEWFPIGLLSSLPTKLNTLITSLSGGNLLALSALTGVAGSYLKYIGEGSFDLVTEAELLTGVATDANVETLAGRATYDAEDEGFSVLVVNVGDGRAAIYFKLSATSADWSDPGYLTGSTGEPGGYRLYLDDSSTSEGVAGDGALRKNHATWAGTTKLWFDMQQIGGSTITGAFARYAGVTGTNKGTLILRGFTGAKHVSFLVTGYTVKSGFFELDVIHLAGSPTFSDLDQLFALPIIDGSDGADGDDGLDGNDGADGQGFNVRGNWSALSGAIAAYDVVAHGGSSWVCISGHTKGVDDDEPGVGVDHLSYWLKWAAQGPQGNQGNPGTNGADGTSLYSRVRVIDTVGLDPADAYEAGDTVSGVVLAENDLVCRAVDGGDPKNGIYVAPAAAAGAAARQASYTTFAALLGVKVFAIEGDNAGRTFQCNSAPGGTIDVDDVSFREVGVVLDEDDFASDDPTNPPSQQSTKQLVESRGPLARLEDQKAADTNAGGYTSGSGWVVRDLNTEIFDPLDIVSISSNTFTPSIDCVVRWSCPGNQVNFYASRLYNVTDSTIDGLGTSEYLSSADTGTGRSDGMALLEAGKTYRIEVRGGTTKSDNGLGIRNTFQTEVYTWVELWSLVS